VVGDGGAVHAKLLHPLYIFFYFIGTVQQTVFRMDVKMRKRHNFPRFRRAGDDTPPSGAASLFVYTNNLHFYHNKKEMLLPVGNAFLLKACISFLQSVFGGGFRADVQEA
jgi:hypothetical protein